jgi:hypothetical protein
LEKEFPHVQILSALRLALLIPLHPLHARSGSLGALLRRCIRDSAVLALFHALLKAGA